MQWMSFAVWVTLKGGTFTQLACKKYTRTKGKVLESETEELPSTTILDHVIIT